jgi:hypothetical protein
MVKDYIGYEALADRALRSVVKDALVRAEKQGLIGAHHFYLTFKTHDPGVEVPDFLKQRYPDEMTIVLQNQFWGLKVGEDEFEVSLTFQKVPATLVVPYSALTAFVDPSVQFGLQFKNSSAVQNAKAPEAKEPIEPAVPTAALPPAGAKPSNPVSAPQIVSLDKFRKK